jgi:hypothetical protein
LAKEYTVTPIHEKGGGTFEGIEPPLSKENRRVIAALRELL